ncbi:MAG: hypothetical protein JZU55_09680 [Afipia sp.]|jgi:hypothetical protein|nr:hypothetical protein [Afipia sp.]
MKSDAQEVPALLAMPVLCDLPLRKRQSFTVQFNDYPLADTPEIGFYGPDR